MAVLQTIRVKLGAFITVVIALALLSFIVDPNTLSSVTQSMSSKYNVGKINGKTISYQDFQNDVEAYTKINEIISGGSVQGEDQQKAIRDAAWRALLDKHLFVQNAKAAGITVGEDELVDLTTGSNISPILAQNPAFLDENGAFAADKLIEFVQNIPSDQSGQFKLYWDYLQNTVLTQQYYAKYGALFNFSNFTNALQAANAVEENNVATAVDFVMVPYSFQRDSSIVISDSDAAKYYKSHKENFKQVDGRDVEFVMFEVIPSEADVAATNEAVAAVHDEFATTDNMKSFLLKNSDRSLSNYFWSAGELASVNSELSAFVDANGEGAVSPIYKDGNYFYAAKVLETKNLPDSVYVKHLLLTQNDAALADSLMTVLSAGKASFPELVAKYSYDKNSAVEKLGDLGWLTQTYMIPGFESVIGAELNKPFILDSQFGKHIVVVSKKTTPKLKKKVAILEKEALASKETFNTFYSQANTLATKSAGKYDNFKAAAAEGGYDISSLRITEATSRYNMVDNAKEITRWAFEQSKPGAVSNIITVNNNYFFVVAVTGTYKEGYADLKTVSNSIKDILYYEKMQEKSAADIATKIEGCTTLEAVADKLGTTVSSKDNVTFASMTDQSLDPIFAGAVSVAKEGEISKPLAGTIGVYVYKVTGRETGSFYSEADAQRYNTQKSQYLSQMLLPVMMTDANVVDHRERFF